MKLKLPILILAFSVACTFGASLYKSTELIEKDIIQLKGGVTIIADNVTRSDQFIFFQTGGQQKMYLKSDVASIGKIKIENDVTLEQRVDALKRKIGPRVGLAADAADAIDYRLIIFAVVFLSSMGFYLFSLVIKKKSIEKDNVSGPGAGENKEKETNGSPDVASTAMKDIVWFFGDVFKIKSGASENANIRSQVAGDFLDSTGKMFELRVKLENEWVKRRMSIAPLAEETGSKSKCFYVIFDTHMVVKIPPAPIESLNDYIKELRKEAEIAAMLSPIKCIIPTVSVVMKKIHSVPYQKELSDPQLEKRYISLLEEKQAFQKHLKVGDNYAFFMELSNSFFLGRVIDELHEAKVNIVDELNERPETLWNQQEFLGRYGADSLGVFSSLQAIYGSCERKIMERARKLGCAHKLRQYEIKQWFLLHLAGKKIEGEFAEITNKLFAEQIGQQIGIVHQFRQTVTKRLKYISFVKNKTQVENLILNMLRLMLQLKELKVSLRDLKPDNLFLDAAPDKYPVFLKSPNAFSIGIIDVETAGSLKPDDKGKIRQPQLGGTPVYATPSHMLENRIIEKVFGNTGDILHLQDWHSAMGIIFKIATGKNLFPKAAKTFPRILKGLQGYKKIKGSPEDMVQKISELFWIVAADEFNKKTSDNKTVLKQLKIPVPKSAAEFFLDILRKEKESLALSIQKLACSSMVSKNEKSRQYLLTATSKSIEQQKSKWEKASQAPGKQKEAARKTFVCLSALEKMKKEQEEKTDTLHRLEGQAPEISAMELLQIVFQMVVERMYKNTWKKLPGRTSL